MKIFLTPKEVCMWLGISRATVWRWRRALDFPRPRKIGQRKTLYVKEEVDKWLATRPVA